jgi:hypothetical protein
MAEWSLAAEPGVIPTKRGVTRAVVADRRVSLAAAAIVLSVVSTTAAEHGRFPGSAELLPSPDGQHSLKWVPSATDQDSHHLLLVDAASKNQVELLAFPRHVEALWSQSGTRLAITDSWASDESTVLLWETLTAKPRDLIEELARVEGQGIARWNAHHLYLEAKGWRGSDTLLLRLWGYGDPSLPAFDRRYRYTVGRGFARE